MVGAVGHFPRRRAPGTDASFAYHAVVAVLAGTGTFRADDGEAQSVGPGCLWFLRPGVHYRYGPLPKAGSWEE